MSRLLTAASYGTPLSSERRIFRLHSRRTIQDWCEHEVWNVHRRRRCEGFLRGDWALQGLRYLIYSVGSTGWYSSTPVVAARPLRLTL